MRSVFILLHRWCGLVIAGFLFITGITGAIISWDHELDDLLNPHLTEVRSRGEAIPSLELARRIEAADPRAWVTFIPLLPEEGKSLAFGVEPRVDPATGKFYELGFNQVFVDPVTGAELGKREWGAVSLARENFVSFLYKLHFTLHMPEMWGIDDWGAWLLGVIAIIWMLDCFSGFFLTLPARRSQRRANEGSMPETLDGERDLFHRPLVTGYAQRTWWQRWQPAWRIRWGAKGYKINFDLHRAGSLWTWALLFILAFTAFSLNLYREVFFPVMSMVSDVTPSPFDSRTPANKHQPIMPVVSYASVIADARREAERRGWPEPAGSVYYEQNYGVYGVDFHYSGDDHGAAGVGPAKLYFDGEDGRYLGDIQPWKGTAADIFVQMQFPLHSGRILGLPGRILISVMGLVVAMLSVTGVYIWLRKRHSRKFAVKRTRQPADAAMTLPGSNKMMGERTK
ncbi:PepSY domain-containing protein [Nitrosospira sp. NpAV]|uniref:PepSY-associated TM helix domain-containing protein n=1 Tax=Nitrosospira sp. NpAV TaxID=58133 RepID=UPI0005A0520F|nr:PepSY-associated TM helix domain-containing protein [Nitrosospira sp. NpAV]KIO47873.1 peptidase [Nitrosospira sp. NpAV]